MMIAHATIDNGRQLIVLGLERGNIERLEEGKPIQINAVTHPGFPLANVEIMIFFGETPRDLLNQVKPMITDETKVVSVPDEAKGKPS